MIVKLLIPMGIKQKDGKIKQEKIGAIIEIRDTKRALSYINNNAGVEVKDDKSGDKRPSKSTSWRVI